jgi:YLP motif-containing protein 1
MEPSYRQSLTKSFKKQIDDGYFNFIIVDSVNERSSYYAEMWSYAKQNGFEVEIFEYA